MSIFLLAQYCLPRRFQLNRLQDSDVEVRFQLTGLWRCVKHTQISGDLTSSVLLSTLNTPSCSSLPWHDSLDLPQDVILPAPAEPYSSKEKIAELEASFPAGYNKGSCLNVRCTPSLSLIITISPDVYKSFRVPVKLSL